MTERLDRARWYISDAWRRMTGLERALLVLLPAALLAIGIATFAVTPNIVREDDAIVRIGMRSAGANAIEFALFVEIKRVGSLTYVPEPNRLELPDLAQLNAAQRSFQWESGAVVLPEPAPALRIDVWRDSAGETKIALVKELYGVWRSVPWSRSNSLDPRPPGLSDDRWTLFEAHHVRVHPMPAAVLRPIWYLLAAVAAFAAVLWSVARLR